MSPAMRALFISPAIAAIATPLYATWLLSEMLADSVFSLESLPAIGKLSLVVLAYLLPLSYLLLATYGTAVYALLRKLGAVRLYSFLAAGVVPGLLLLLSPFSYQESAVPGIFFGALIAVVAWFLLRNHTRANNSFKPNPLRGSA
jgi:hypothetical protein